MSEELPRRFGPYVLVAPLAKSARSRVFLARATGEARLASAPVVVKMHQPPLDDAALERARRRAVQSSPHSPRISEIGRGDAQSFVVMEHVAGWTLARVLESNPERWPVLSVARMAAGVAHALGRLGVLPDPDRVHGRIDLSRIMLGVHGRSALIGLDRPPEGALGYAAPEQLADATLDPRTDLYALAAIMWRLLTGTPWIAPGSPAQMRAATLDAEPRSVRALVPEIPARLDALLQTTLSPEPAARFASADDFRDALIALVPGADTAEPDPSELVGEALWSTRESTRTALARVAESMVAFHRPEDSFDEWGKVVPVIAETHHNVARQTPIGAVRRVPATILRHPDEAGTPRTDSGAGTPIPYVPEEVRRAEAEADTHRPSSPRLQAPTFPGTWAAGASSPTPPRAPTHAGRGGAATEEVLANVRVVTPPDDDRTRPLAPRPSASAPTPAASWPAMASSTAELARPRPTTTRRSAPPRRMRVGPLVAVVGAAVLALGAALVVLRDDGAQATTPVGPVTTAAPVRAIAAVASTVTPANEAAQVGDRPQLAEVGARPPPPPQPSDAADTRPPPPPQPSDAASAQPTATPRPTLAPPPTPQPSGARPTATPRPTLAPPPSPREPTATPPSTVAPSPPPPPDRALAEVRRLLVRARGARAKASPAQASEIDRVIGALILEANAPDAPGIDVRLRALETTLVRLEARAP